MLLEEGGRRKYGDDFTKMSCDIWQFLKWRCGELLAPMLRLMIAFLADEFNLDGLTRSLLSQVSPATIDQLLVKEKTKLRIRNKNLTRPGTC